MSDIILIHGKVKHQVNLDPTLWIFDDRRFQMAERFPGIEGLGMELAPFLDNAQPAPGATQGVIHQQNGSQHIFTLEELYRCVLQFARDGKPIHPEGPALLYQQDGSNRNQPLGFIEQIEIC
ncbi:hypothetical protein GXN76_12485 [Kroppenstedtia pulmonis]|uniref:Uncharacterized protein n=1 Tax=Kroppenstedtia pulmonis TaxID=1380685 RepID=A0A7D3XSN6_9BACL|nr:hypothetical protein [Kroppenstedtia pulmonis]QKG85208.1 hypothetical protein GXN76_12485 [Kroppenstedtia pulmonis]